MSRVRCGVEGKERGKWGSSFLVLRGPPSSPLLGLQRSCVDAVELRRQKCTLKVTRQYHRRLDLKLEPDPLRSQDATHPRLLPLIVRLQRT
jgi:hypothetical protein